LRKLKDKPSKVVIIIVFYIYVCEALPFGWPFQQHLIVPPTIEIVRLDHPDHPPVYYFYNTNLYLRQLIGGGLWVRSSQSSHLKFKNEICVKVS
jgi:hypothetical protein